MVCTSRATELLFRLLMQPSAWHHTMMRIVFTAALEGASLKLIELNDYPFNRVEITWHGPFPWSKDMSNFWTNDRALIRLPGVYRAESPTRKELSDFSQL